MVKKKNHNIQRNVQPTKATPKELLSPELPSEETLSEAPLQSEISSAKELPSEMVIDVPIDESEIFGADFQRFERYIDECAKYNDAVQGHFDRLQKQIGVASSRESAIKRKINDEVINNNSKREKAVLDVVQELQEAYDRNTAKLRDHHQQQISRLVDKHKLEIAKWKSKYEQIKLDKIVSINDQKEAATVDPVKDDHGDDELMKAKEELEVTKKNLSRKTDVCEYLRSEVAKYKSKVSELECIIEKEKKDSKEYILEKERFQRDLEKKNHIIENKENEIMELLDLQLNEKKWKNKCNEFEKKHQLLLLEIESIKRKNAALYLEIERKDNELESLSSEKNKLKKSHEALKKICNELERQVESFTQKFTNASSAKKSLQQQQCSISDEMSQLKNELYLANQKYTQIHSEKEDILNKLTNKENEFKIMLTIEKNRTQNLQHNLEMAQDSVRRLEDKVAWLEANIEDSNIIIKRLEQYNSTLNKQLTKIKEETSVYISQIYDLEKEKQVLHEKLENSIALEKALQVSNRELRKFFEMKEEEMNQKKHILEETTLQQMKLIEYLAPQSDDKTYKRMATLFSSKTLEQKFQDAQRELISQRAKNIILNEHLTSANEELSKHLKEVELLSCEINELKNCLFFK